MANRNSGRMEGNIDYYALLGAHPQDTPDEIRRKWYELSKQFHPDHVSGREAEVWS